MASVKSVISSAIAKATQKKKIAEPETFEAGILQPVLPPIPQHQTISFQQTPLPFNPQTAPKLTKPETQPTTPSYLQKGGYIDSKTGQYIPPKDTTKINFLPDGRVEYTPKGSNKTITLSRDEYKGLLGESGGLITENVLKIRDIESGQARARELAAQVGKIAPESPETQNLAIPQQPQAQIQPGQPGQPGQPQMGVMQEGTPINWKQVRLAAMSNPSTWSRIVSRGGMFAVGGGTIGSAVPGVGTVAGGIIGGIVGVGLAAWESVRDSIDKQQRDIIFTKKTALTEGQRNLNKLVSLANLDPENADKYVTAFNEQLSQISLAYQQLKIDTQRDIYLALSNDGLRELAKYELFFSEGGAYDYYTTKMQLALGAPNPEEGIRGLLMAQEEKNEE